MITVGIASIPQRSPALVQAIASVLPDVDQVNVYLNGYEEVPGFLGRSKIRVFRSQEEQGRISDRGKFYRVPDSGYYLTIDDDIEYPAGYVEGLVQAIEKYGRDVAVSYMGARLTKIPTESFYHDGRVKKRLFGHLDNDWPCHLPGTGCLAFHAGTIDVNYSDFRASHMADIWFGLALQRQNAGAIVLAHSSDYCQPSPYIDRQEGSIYQRFRGQDEKQTQMVNDYGDWTLNAST